MKNIIAFFLFTDIVRRPYIDVVWLSWSRIPVVCYDKSWSGCERNSSNRSVEGLPVPYCSRILFISLLHIYIHTYCCSLMFGLQFVCHENMLIEKNRYIHSLKVNKILRKRQFPVLIGKNCLENCHSDTEKMQNVNRYLY